MDVWLQAHKLHQLGGFFAVVITATLLLFSASIYMVAQLTEQDDDDAAQQEQANVVREVLRVRGPHPVACLGAPPRKNPLPREK